MSWTGWALAATVLVVRGGRRVRSITLLSVVLALAVYAGQPDMLIVFGMALAVFALVLLVCRAGATRQLRAVVRPGIDLAVSLGAGLALSAPLLLPGLQVLAGSVRSTGGGALGTQRAIPTSLLQPLVFPGSDGWPLLWWRNYVGVLAVALAATAFVVTIIDVVRRRGRAPVVALGVVALLATAVTFVQPVESALNHLPLLEAVRFPRTLNLVEFAVAILAGVGLDLVMRSSQRRSVVVAALAVFSAAGAALAVVWLSDADYNAATTRGGLWALAAIVLVLAAVGALAFVGRRQQPTGPIDAGPQGSTVGDPATAATPVTEVRPGGTRAGSWSSRVTARVAMGVGLVLLVFETVFLVGIGDPLWSSTARPLTPTPAEAELQRVVGTSLVALGKPWCAPALLGIPANTNSLLGVHQLVDYDPLLPNRYYQSWYAMTGQPGGLPELSYFCPGIETAARSAPLRGLLRPRAGRVTWSHRGDLRPADRRRGPLPHPRRRDGDARPGARFDRAPPRRRRRTAGGRGPSHQQHPADDDGGRPTPGAPDPTDQRKGVARDDRRTSLAVGDLLGGHAPGPRARRPTRHFPALLADVVDRRIGPGRHGRHRAPRGCGGGPDEAATVGHDLVLTGPGAPATGLDPV